MSEGQWYNKQEDYSEFGLPIVRRGQIANSEATFIESERKGSDWKKTLESQEKDFLEIAGPSLFYGEEEIIRFDDYKDRLTCTNVSTDLKLKKPDGTLADAKDYVDVVADAAQLPFKDGSFGAVFVRDFRMEDSKRTQPKPLPLQADKENNEYFRAVIKEMRRVLDDGGLAVCLNIERTDLASLQSSGLDMVFCQQRNYPNGRTRYQVVFQKQPQRAA
jgi:hypothetical protein